MDRQNARYPHEEEDWSAGDPHNMDLNFDFMLGGANQPLGRPKGSSQYNGLENAQRPSSIHNPAYDPQQGVSNPASRAFEFDPSWWTPYPDMTDASAQDGAAELGQAVDWDQVFSEGRAAPDFTNSNVGQDDSAQVEAEDDAQSCNSACGASCPSQCGETGHGICCDDDACASPSLCQDQECQEADRPCTDENCTAAPGTDEFTTGPKVTDGDKAAAEALASFVESQPLPPFQPLGYAGYPTTGTGGGYASNPGFDLGANLWTSMDMSETVPCGSLSMDNLLPSHPNLSMQPLQAYPEFSLARHIMQHHYVQGAPSGHPPCVADHPSQLIPTCSLPPPPPSGSSNIPQHLYNRTCGFQVQDPRSFAQHIYQEHAPFLPPGAMHPSVGPPFNFHMQHPPPPQIPRPTLSVVFNKRRIRRPPKEKAAKKRKIPSNPSSASTSPSLANTMSAPPSTLVTPPATSDLSSTIEVIDLEAEETAKDASAMKEVPANNATIETEPLVICRWRVDEGSEICGRTFDTAAKLQSHCDSEHIVPHTKKDEGGFWCLWESCMRTAPFPQRNKLERHVQIHTGHKPFVCPECPERFAAKQALVQHINTHKGQKPWFCTWPECTATFTQQSALTMHYRTHTGEKPLVCDVCGKSFSESSNLSKHRRIHAAKRMFDCEICLKDFNRLDQVRRHIKSNHPDRVGEMEEILQRVRDVAASRQNPRGRGTRASPKTVRKAGGESVDLEVS